VIFTLINVINHELNLVCKFSKDDSRRASQKSDQFQCLISSVRTLSVGTSAAVGDDEFNISALRSPKSDKQKQKAKKQLLELER
jgi:hypothetical protein